MKRKFEVTDDDIANYNITKTDTVGSHRRLPSRIESVMLSDGTIVIANSRGEFAVIGNHNDQPRQQRAPKRTSNNVQSIFMLDMPSKKKDKHNKKKEPVLLALL